MSVTVIKGVLRAGLIGALAIMSSALFPAPAAAEATTYLRLVHLSPDTPPVDVYVASVGDPGTAMVVLGGMGYGTLSEYQVLPGGTYTVSMRPAGADASTPAVLAATLEAASGSAHTVASVGTFDDLSLTVLADDLTLPPSGQARARVIQAAASQPQLDISIQGGQNLGRDVDFATTTPYSNIAAGQSVLQVSVDDQTLSEFPMTVNAGSVYSLLILDTPTGVAAAMEVDATAASVVPVGGMETGAGGLATGSQRSSAVFASSGTSHETALPWVPALVGLALLSMFGVLAALVARPSAGQAAAPDCQDFRLPKKSVWAWR